MKIRNEDYNWNGLHLRVTVEDDDWFGYGAIIRSGVAIGEGSSAASG
jgi:acetyltransferase-like isoleucine patch superfamily enzyme